MTFISPTQFQDCDAKLTDRQREVLVHLLRAKDDETIGKNLYILAKTVRKHLSDISKIFGSGTDQSFTREQVVAHYARYRPDLFQDSLVLSPKKLDAILIYRQHAKIEYAIAKALIPVLNEQCSNYLCIDQNIWIDHHNFGTIPSRSKQIQDALHQTQNLLVLLSPESEQETITEMVKFALDASCQVIPIYIDCLDRDTNHDLRHYLHETPPLLWSSALEVTKLTQQVVALIHGEISPFDEPNVPIEISPKQPDSTLELPPTPIAEPELPGGMVDLTSKFYVERPGVDDRCYEAIQKPYALIRIKAPRQMGKTSLMARILHQAKQWGCTTAFVSLQLVDSECLESLETFLLWLCAQIADRLGKPLSLLQSHWDKNTILGSKRRCSKYLEKYILDTVPEKFVLGLDEVDVVFERDRIASDFFGLLRAWHEQSKHNKIWQKLSLVVVHSTEAYVSLPITQSPFNVGLPIELPEFNAAQVRELAQYYGLNWSNNSSRQLLETVGGHPYLVRLALYHMARDRSSLTEILAEAPTDAGIYRDHLRRILWMLEKSELSQAALSVMEQPAAMDLAQTSAFKLQSMGLVIPEGNRFVSRCNLYRQYLQTHLSKT